MGWLAERGWDRHVVRCLLAMLAGEAIIDSLGLAWLSRFVPGNRLLESGLYPFIPGDLVKLFLASVTPPAAWRALELLRR